MTCTQPPTPLPQLDSNFTAVKFETCREPIVSRVQAVYRQLVTRFITSNFTGPPQLQAVKFGKV
jgi:hypothetical protein